MTPGVHLLVVRPHPDDESSATGGLLARYAALGVRTAVVTCTRGEEGEIHDPDLDPEEAHARLGDIREAELRAACQVLGVSELHLLGYRDSGHGRHARQSAPGGLLQRRPGRGAAGRLVRIIRRLQPQVVVTENVDASYSHPDHIMGSRVSVRAFAAAGDPAEYPEAGPIWQPARLYAVVSVRDRWDQIAAMMEAAGPGHRVPGAAPPGGPRRVPGRLHGGHRRGRFRRSPAQRAGRASNPDTAR